MEQESGKRSSMVKEEEKDGEVTLTSDLRVSNFMKAKKAQSRFQK